MTPDGVRSADAGVDVFVETGAGAGASISDDDYRAAGADIVASAAGRERSSSSSGEEPQHGVITLTDQSVLFTHLHLAAYPEVAAALQAAARLLAYETVQLANGALRAARPDERDRQPPRTQMGAHYLERHNGGRGVLMGGAPGVRPRVVVIGAGNVGWNAAWIAGGMEPGHRRRPQPRPAALGRRVTGRITTLASNRGRSARRGEADLVIGGPGRRRTGADRGLGEMVRAMSRAVIVDVAVDQGSCIETTGDQPPGSGLRTPRRGALRRRQHARCRAAHQHLCAHQRHAPLHRGVAVHGPLGPRDPALAAGINTVAGAITNAPVAEFLGAAYVDPLVALAG